MTAINRFIVGYMLNCREIWNERLDALEHDLKRMDVDEKKNNHS
ncbi:hypothetical protein QNH46_21170 [Paenibacillus woosongensis]|uniref:Uncharacterized protein n=1 Tax=Paenibacillus woosongensis TaxID=307580 RepID=A0AA95L0N2_9BACL|nr:hypothetical protein [Paenibacillus woosongensis]WHX48549.1 hypothetical protein QNH46_21170 [Paenibacillus woosongensis]